MAITDILERLKSDADAEAAIALGDAGLYAERVRTKASAEAEAETERTLERARREVRRDADTLLANARLEARDADLSARSAMVAETLRAAEEALAALPDAEYAALVARGVIQAAAGGEIASVAAADSKRLRKPLAAALKSAHLDVALGDDDPALARGVMLVGDRTSVEVSAAAMVASRRGDLVRIVDELLFGASGSERE